MVKWNDGVSFPIQSGHPASVLEPNYWDNRPMYQHIASASLPDSDRQPDRGGPGDSHGRGDRHAPDRIRDSPGDAQAQFHQVTPPPDSNVTPPPEA